MRALPTCNCTRWRPLSTNDGNSSASVTAIPTGANTHASSVRRSGPRSIRPPPGVPSDTIPAEHVLLVSQLAGVLHQEAGAAHELVGLLGQHPLVALGLVLLVGRLFVLGLVLDDQALLEDHIEAGFDVFVVGLLLFLVV